MKKPLTHTDIVKGQRYKVIKVPEHLKGLKYPWLNITGTAIWVQGHNMVCMQFGGCKERVVPPECLEEVEEPQIIIDCSKEIEAESGEELLQLYKNLSKENEQNQHKQGMVTEQTAKLNELYRIVAVPEFWAKISNKYPSLGGIGRLIKICNNFGTLRLSGGTQRFVPFNCMELVTVRIPPLQTTFNLNDQELIEKMVSKPKSTLKIIRGLAKMNKDFRLVTFVEKGLIL